MYKQPDIYQEAEKRVRTKAKFYKHLFAYLVINGFVFVTAVMEGDPTGAFMMMLCWGIGLAFHYLKVFGFPGSGVLSREWEDKEYQKEIDRLEKKRQPPNLAEEQLDLKEMAKNYRDSDLV